MSPRAPGGWPGTVLTLAAIACLLLGLLILAGTIHLDLQVLVGVLVIAIGALLMMSLLQQGKRVSDVLDLHEALSVGEIRSLHMKHEFPNELARRVARAQSFVLDTDLNADVPRLAGISPQKEYERALAARVHSGQIAFRKVVCIFHAEAFRKTLETLAEFSGTDYYIRHLAPPPVAIPIIHMMSFDNEHFFLGGYYSAESSAQEYVAYIRHPATSSMLKDYWQVLWERATPLNSGREIDWEELWKIAERVGIDDVEFRGMKRATLDRLRSKG